MRNSCRTALAVLACAGSWLLASACAADSPAEKSSALAGDGDAASVAPVESGVAAESAVAADWRTHVARVQGETLRERFLHATENFLGTPYHNGPLGEGEFGGPDADPRVDFGRADCVTYLEQSLALALVEDAGDLSGDAFLRGLDHIRYRDGQVSFADRNHYMVTDWVVANDWLVTDVTTEVGGEHVTQVTRTIDRPKFLLGQGIEPRPGVDVVEERELTMIPVDAIAAVDAHVQDGDLVLWIGGVKGIFSLHTGLATRGDDGSLLFRHASSRAKKAVEQDFAEYAASTKFRGFVLLRIRDDAKLPATVEG